MMHPSLLFSIAQSDPYTRGYPPRITQMLFFLFYPFFRSSTPHAAAATANTNSRYHRFSRLNPPSCISRYPQAAGNIFPAVCSASGSIPAGNMIPDSMMEGRKRICSAIVSFP